jgi:hypothetical protein
MKSILLLLAIICSLHLGAIAQNNKFEPIENTPTSKFQFKDGHPNPANTEVTFKYNFASGTKSASIVLFNVLGSKVKTIELSAQEETAMLDVTDLNPGVYFYTLNIDGVNKLSRWLVIKR